MASFISGLFLWRKSLVGPWLAHSLANAINLLRKVHHRTVKIRLEFPILIKSEDRSVFGNNTVFPGNELLGIYRWTES